MDRRVRPLRLLIASAALAVAGAAAGAAGEHTLQALVWIAPGHEAAALTRQPTVCLGERGNDPAVLAGRALFNAPQLLGGQAARAGISCASCHTNGRANAHFQLAGISDGPGTADVSASFFGVARGNARFDPKPIPDLALPGRISHDPQSRDLERFLHGLIVEEFSGVAPGEPVLQDLSAYVRAVKPCSDRDSEQTGIAAQIELFRDSLRSAARAAMLGDARAIEVLTSAARSQLGLIDERLAPGRHAALSGELLRTSRRLQTLQGGAVTPETMRAVLVRFDRTLAPRLLQAEWTSLYRPEVVDRWLARRTR